MNLLCKIFLFLLLFASTTAFAQLPPNIGFENGNFNGWETSIGRRDDTYIITMDPPSAPVPGRHTIIGPSQKNDLDLFGHFPVHSPNGSGYSIKLGNTDIPRHVNRISRTFRVPPNFSLVFNYAVVLDANTSHTTDDEQPFFKVEVIDVATGIALPCPLSFVATSGLPGFQVSDVISVKPNTTPARNFNTNPIYRDWSTASINLKDYANRNVRLEFTTANCDGDIHFAYAYIDIDEKLSLNPITGNIFCNNQSTTTLVGPTGFADYVWYKKSDPTTPIPGQSIVVPAVNGVEYELHITPYLNLGCPEILPIKLEELPEFFSLTVAPEVYGCPGTGVDLTTSSVRSGSGTMTYSYYKDEFGLVYLPNPERVTQSGEYFIRGTNGGGCTDIRKVKVILVDPDITVTNPPPVNYPNKVDLSLTYISLPGYNYDYFADPTLTKAINFMAGITGTYYIKATSNLGCTVFKSVKVVINPPPPYTIEAPNTFTPNGDGMNDLFKIKIDGFVSLTQLTIFNRYGQQVFTTRSINDYWTGNSGSSQLPAGTYYWIFDGIDDYYHTKVKKSSSITIIR